MLKSLPDYVHRVHDYCTEWALSWNGGVGLHMTWAYNFFQRQQAGALHSIAVQDMFSTLWFTELSSPSDASARIFSTFSSQQYSSLMFWSVLSG